jgi:hypothetical protein
LAACATSDAPTHSGTGDGPADSGSAEAAGGLADSATGQADSSSGGDADAATGQPDSGLSGKADTGTGHSDSGSSGDADTGTGQPDSGSSGETDTGTGQPDSGSGGQADTGTGQPDSGSSGKADSGSAHADGGVTGGKEGGTTEADAQAADGSVSIPGVNNPVLSGLFADPNVTVFDKTFYIYPTTDGFPGWGATTFSVFSSTNLVEWTNRGVILDVSTALKWATGHAWAPTVAYVGGNYYFYFSADQQIGVATSASPTGPFADALGHPLVSSQEYGVGSFDPYVFIDDDGSRYLYFGNSGLRVGKLNADMTSFSNTPANITPAGISGTVEGSAMFKRSGTYYLQWSEGDTNQPTYKVAYARAQSPLGPFTRLATILEQDPTLGILGPGGSTVLGIPARDEYYIVYHRFKIPGGDGTHRETCIDRLYFNSDGTIVPVKPTLEGLQATVQPP